MDKVVIVGVFDFVNFHVCKALLEKGFEVRGVQIESEENGDDLVEKRLEIGRNANFTEVALVNISKDSYEDHTIVISTYDLYMLYKEEYLQNEEIRSNLINMHNWEQIVILVPSQLLTNKIETSADVIIDDFISRTKAHNKNIYLVYLPTIFGPWQPDTFFFQSSILRKMDRGKPFRGFREETRDALFVDDTVESIIDLIENKDPGRYLLQSGKSNQWDLCASLLQINEQHLNTNEEFIEENITKLIAKSTVPISTALKKQIDHASRLNS